MQKAAERRPFRLCVGHPRMAWIYCRAMPGGSHGYGSGSGIEPGTNTPSFT